MGYYRGDYYRGDRGNYYRGDPFLGAVVGSVVGRAAGRVGSFIGKKLAPAARQVARDAAPGVVGGAVGFAAGQRAGTMTGPQPSLMPFFGEERKKYRRMNPLNPKALRRALRRAEGFEKFAKRTVNALYKTVDGRRVRTYKKRKSS